MREDRALCIGDSDVPNHSHVGFERGGRSIGIGTIASGLVALASGSSSAEHAEAFSPWGELIRCGRAGALADAITF